MGRGAACIGQVPHQGLAQHQGLQAERGFQRVGRGLFQPQPEGGMEAFGGGGLPSLGPGLDQLVSQQ